MAAGVWIPAFAGMTGRGGGNDGWVLLACQRWGEGTVGQVLTFDDQRGVLSSLAHQGEGGYSRPTVLPDSFTYYRERLCFGGVVVDDVARPSFPESKDRSHMTFHLAASLP